MSRFPLFTQRLVLRPFCADDLDTLVAYRNDPDVARYQDWDLPYTEDMALDRIASDSVIVEFAIGGEANFAIADRKSNELFGDLYVHLSADAVVASIGYTLARAHWGCGYASEAVAAIIKALFGSGVTRIEAGTDPMNARSRSLLKRLGFADQGVVERGAYVRGSWAPDARYVLAQSSHWEHR